MVSVGDETEIGDAALLDILEKANLASYFEKFKSVCSNLCYISKNLHFMLVFVSGQYVQ